MRLVFPLLRRPPFWVPRADTSRYATAAASTAQVITSPCSLAWRSTALSTMPSTLCVARLATPLASSGPSPRLLSDTRPPARPRRSPRMTQTPSRSRSASTPPTTPRRQATTRRTTAATARCSSSSSRTATQVAFSRAATLRRVRQATPRRRRRLAMVLRRSQALRRARAPRLRRAASSSRVAGAATVRRAFSPFCLLPARAQARLTCIRPPSPWALLSPPPGSGNKRRDVPHGLEHRSASSLLERRLAALLERDEDTA